MNRTIVVSSVWICVFVFALKEAFIDHDRWLFLLVIFVLF